MLRRIGIALVVAVLAAPQRANGQCPDVLSSERSGAAAAALGQTILVAGGWDTLGADLVSDVVDIYDVLMGTWSLAALSEPRTELAAASAQGRALFAGGRRINATFPYSHSLDTVDIHDAASGAWSASALSIPRWGLAGASVGSSILFAGGFEVGAPDYVPTKRVDVYDTATGSWSLAELSFPRGEMAATTVGSRVLFAGGRWGGFLVPTNPVAVVDILDAASGVWSVAQLSVPRWGLAAASAGGRAYFAGGADSQGTHFDVVDVYDAASGTWSTAQLSEPRTRLAAAASGARVFFAGGFGPGGPSSRVDILDTATGLWSTAELAIARHGLAGAAAPRTALFAGGSVSSVAYSDAVSLFSSGHPRSFCHGDGSGTPCPCGNEGPAGHGCTSSIGTGALLAGAGCNRAAADGLIFEVRALPPGSPLLLFAGRSAVNGGLGTPFGDGLLCAGGAIVRLGLQLADAAGEATYGPGLGAAAGWQAGDLWRLQAWHRDPGSPCGSGFGLSNGLELGIVP